MEHRLGAAFTVHAMTHERVLHLHPNSSCAEIILAPDDASPEPTVSGWCESLQLSCRSCGDRTTIEEDAARLAQALSRWRHQGVTDVVIHCEDGVRRAGPIVSAIAAAGFGRSQFWETRRTSECDEFCNAVSRALTSLLRDTALH